MTIKEFMYRHYVIGMFKGLDGRIRVLKNGTDKNIMNRNDDDFEICNKSFNELFSELKPSQIIFIEEVGDVIKTFGILDMKLDDISLKANCLNFE